MDWYGMGWDGSVWYGILCPREGEGVSNIGLWVFAGIPLFYWHGVWS